MKFGGVMIVFSEWRSVAWWYWVEVVGWMLNKCFNDDDDEV